MRAALNALATVAPDWLRSWVPLEWFDRYGQPAPLTAPLRPLTVPRSPQGRPVLIQAGGSERGKDFAAQWGEVIFELNTHPPK